METEKRVRFVTHEHECTCNNLRDDGCRASTHDCSCTKTYAFPWRRSTAQFLYTYHCMSEMHECVCAGLGDWAPYKKKRMCRAACHECMHGCMYEHSFDAEDKGAAFMGKAMDLAEKSIARHKHTLEENKRARAERVAQMEADRKEKTSKKEQETRFLSQPLVKRIIKSTTQEFGMMIASMKPEALSFDYETIVRAAAQLGSRDSWGKLHGLYMMAIDAWLSDVARMDAYLRTMARVLDDQSLNGLHIDTVIDAIKVYGHSPHAVEILRITLTHCVTRSMGSAGNMVYIMENVRGKRGGLLISSTAAYPPLREEVKHWYLKNYVLTRIGSLETAKAFQKAQGAEETRKMWARATGLVQLGAQIGVEEARAAGKRYESSPTVGGAGGDEETA